MLIVLRGIKLHELLNHSSEPYLLSPVIELVAKCMSKVEKMKMIFFAINEPQVY